MAIYQANKEQIRDPNLIYPGQVIELPSANKQP
jgi:nucleoid-associated protein YgaU